MTICKKCLKEIERTEKTAISWKYCFDCVCEIVKEYDKKKDIEVKKW